MFFRKDPLDTVKKALSSKSPEKLQAAVTDVLKQHGLRAPSTHELMVFLQNNKIASFELLLAYVRANPDCATSAEAKVAEVLANNGKADQATLVARSLLRKLFRLRKQNGSLSKGENDLAAQTHVLITAVYIEVGARSYALRLMNQGLALANAPATLAFLNREILHVEKELTDPALLELNQKWELFYQTGAGAKELAVLCEQKSAPNLAKRLDLLESNFRFKLGYRPGPEEFTLEVHEMEVSGAQKVFTLA